MLMILKYDHCILHVNRITTLTEVKAIKNYHRALKYVSRDVVLSFSYYSACYYANNN